MTATSAQASEIQDRMASASKITKPVLAGILADFEPGLESMSRDARYGYWLQMSKANLTALTDRLLTSAVSA